MELSEIIVLLFKWTWVMWSIIGQLLINFYSLPVRTDLSYGCTRGTGCSACWCHCPPVSPVVPLRTARSSVAAPCPSRDWTGPPPSLLPPVAPASRVPARQPPCACAYVGVEHPVTDVSSSFLPSTPQQLTAGTAPSPLNHSYTGHSHHHVPLPEHALTHTITDQLAHSLTAPGGMFHLYNFQIWWESMKTNAVINQCLNSTREFLGSGLELLSGSTTGSILTNANTRIVLLRFVTFVLSAAEFSLYVASGLRRVASILLKRDYSVKGPKSECWWRVHPWSLPTDGVIDEALTCPIAMMVNKVTVAPEVDDVQRARSDDENSPNNAPSSTPRKDCLAVDMSGGSPAISSSFPLQAPSTLNLSSEFLSPADRIARRFRSYSQTSDGSASDRDVISAAPDESGKTKKKRKAAGPKLISTDGAYHLDRKEKCEVYYIEEFLSLDQAERLKDSLACVDGHCPDFLSLDEDDGLPAVDTSLSNLSGDVDYNTLLRHYVQKVEKALAVVFDVQTKITRVLVRELPDYSRSIPYETFSEKSSNPVVVILPVGAPRPLSLKTIKGKKVTHTIPLHSGSLSVLAGETSLHYNHSIPRGRGTGQQISLFFIGSPSKEMVATEVQPLGSQSDTNSEFTEPEVELSGDQLAKDDESPTTELIEFSIFQNLPPEYTSLKKELEDVATPTIEVTSPSPGPVIKSAARCHLHPTPSVPLEPSPVASECNKTVINMDTLKDPDHVLTDREAIDQLRLVHSTADLSLVHSSMEKTLVDLVSKVDALTHEVSALKGEMAGVSLTKASSPRSSLDAKESKEVLDKLGRSLDSMKNMKHYVDETCKRIVRSQTETTQILDSINETKTDLKRWYSSTFFKEDSQSLKAIHACVKKMEKVQSCSALPLPPPPPLTQADVAGKQKSAGLPSSPTRKQRNLPHDWLDSGTSSSCQQVNLDNFKDFPSYAQATQKNIVGYHDPAGPIDWSATSRSSSGFSMTQSMKQPAASSESGTGFHHSAFYGPGGYPGSAQQSKKPKSTSSNTQQHSTRPSGWQPPRNQSTSRQRNVSLKQPAPQPRMFNTVLVTDSIMKRVGEGDIGGCHAVCKIRKGTSSGLNDNDVRETVRRSKPDFVYVHVGINDLCQGKKISSILNNYYNLLALRDEDTPSTKVIFSWPLLTSDKILNKSVVELRDGIKGMLGNLDHFATDSQAHYFNRNSNLDNDDDMYLKDGVHLSVRGERYILANMRYSIHSLCREIQNKSESGADLQGHRGYQGSSQPGRV